MKNINSLALLVIVIGALNYAIFSIFNINVLAYVSFGYDIVKNVIYFLIGFAGLIVMFQMFRKKQSKI